MIRISVVCVVVVFTLCNSGITSSLEWNYKHQEEWPATCIKGTLQSPIALDGSSAEETNFPPFIFQGYDTVYKASKITNNGHTVKIQLNSSVNSPNVTGGGLSSVYYLDSIHFHWDSEHTIDAKRFPLELHMVLYDGRHKDLSVALTKENGVAVLGVLFYLSPDDDSELVPLFSSIEAISKRKLNQALILTEELELDDLLPRDRAGFYRYRGSLTTPECNEGIIWTIFTHTLPISRKQLKIFPTLLAADNLNQTIDSNYRALQEVNGRKVEIKISGATTGAAGAVEVPGALKIFILFIAIFKFL